MERRVLLAVFLIVPRALRLPGVLCPAGARAGLASRSCRAACSPPGRYAGGVGSRPRVAVACDGEASADVGPLVGGAACCRSDRARDPCGERSRHGGVHEPRSRSQELASQTLSGRVEADRSSLSRRWDPGSSAAFTVSVGDPALDARLGQALFRADIVDSSRDASAAPVTLTFEFQDQAACRCARSSASGPRRMS